MNQEIKILGELIITFTWFDDKKVWVKYFRNGEEIEEFSHLDLTDRNKCMRTINTFETENQHLTMYSY